MRQLHGCQGIVGGVWRRCDSGGRQRHQQWRRNDGVAAWVWRRDSIVGFKHLGFVRVVLQWQIVVRFFYFWSICPTQPSILNFLNRRHTIAHHPTRRNHPSSQVNKNPVSKTKLEWLHTAETWLMTKTLQLNVLGLHSNTSIQEF